ncbi:hypothetical protein [Microbacterium sp. YY-01]|uniref:hypothetical protein n=1 Tax=Microbacterium sp. YY-01 TaxID=3421634 RepID=UPI003D164BC2
MKDKRLYMTFPNDVHRHPKIKRLPPEVRWTFIEMNGEARIADNDGRFAAEDAEFLWSQDHLEALMRSHPTRPLVVRDGTDYVIREYAKHQQTRAERERLAEVSRANGAKGGRPRKKPDETQQKPSGLLNKPRGNLEEPNSKHSQSQSQRTNTYVNESQSLDTRAREATDELSPTQNRMASSYGIDVERVQAKLSDQLGMNLTKLGALTIALWIIGKRDEPPRAPTAYVIGSITRSPAEIEKHIHDNGLS